VLSPDDEDIRARLMQVYLATGDFVRARECASTSIQFKAIAGQLEAMGQSGEALVALRDAARLDPSDAALRERLARVFVERGDMTSAAEYLTVETAGSDPKLLLLVADILLRSGRIDEGMEIARRLLADDPMRRQDVALVGWTIAEHAPEAGFRIVELAADVAVAQADWPSAAAALQEFVTRVPNHIQALMRLVEICVDGGLEATMYSAQAQLADAYITAGAASEARFIAEDLVAREPWDRANIERFRRALVLMGEPDPDGLIAERLSGQSPFMSTDLSLHGDELPPFEALPGPAPSSTDVAPQKVVRAPAPARSDSLEPSPDTGHPPGVAADSDTLATAFARPESVEVDLDVVPGEARKPIASAAPPVPGPIAADLDGVFAQIRDDASRRSTTADDEYKRGLALFKAGQIDECIPVLQAASKAPRLRFVTAAILARIFQERGLMPQAVEWFERAAEAPPPTEDEGHRVLYELADALEATGESSRALAICIELQAEAGDYRDIAARVERLAKVQSRG
jgi:tetratricopeptide (TPR) repeat protein